MAFTKGISGNINGRPKGSQNKAAGNLRNVITDFLEQRFEQVIEDFEQLDEVINKLILAHENI